jgi:hypothetical protein
MPRKQTAPADRTGGITQRQAQTVAGRLQALQAAGYPMTAHLRWVLRVCTHKAAGQESTAGRQA